jgi:hypothetical protein
MGSMGSNGIEWKSTRVGYLESWGVPLDTTAIQAGLDQVACCQNKPEQHGRPTPSLSALCLDQALLLWSA